MKVNTNSQEVSNTELFIILHGECNTISGDLNVQGNGIFNCGINLSTSPANGSIKWSGTDIVGYKGGGWTSLTTSSGGGGGSGNGGNSINKSYVFQLKNITSTLQYLTSFIGFSIDSANTITNSCIIDYQKFNTFTTFNSIEINIIDADLNTAALSYELQIIIDKGGINTTTILLSIPQSTSTTFFQPLTTPLQLNKDDTLKLQLKQ